MAWNGYSTDKQQNKAFDKMVSVAKKWADKGYSTEIIASGIRNKFGYQCEAKSDNEIHFQRIRNSDRTNTTYIQVVTF